MNRPSRRVSADAVDDVDPSDRTILVGATGRGREVRVRSHRTAQRVSAAIAVVVVVGTVVWFWRAFTLLDQCDGDDLCQQPVAVLRWLQFAVASVGLVTGPAIALYLARFVVTGRIWRRSRELALTHALLVFAWLILWAIGALTV